MYIHTYNSNPNNKKWRNVASLVKEWRDILDFYFLYHYNCYEISCYYLTFNYLLCHEPMVFDMYFSFD